MAEKDQEKELQNEADQKKSESESDYDELDCRPSVDERGIYHPTVEDYFTRW